MQTEVENNGSSQQSELDKVLEKIAEIAKKSADGDYIYRGEPECYEKVSSNLYRQYEVDIKAEHFDIAAVQEGILREAKEYTHKTNEFEILTELQHYGGKTNLIDFTTNCFVALFFACDGKPAKPGRVILLQKPPKVSSKPYKVEKPPRTIRRAEAQKSIFVQAEKGFVEPDKVVCIPADLKVALLGYLRKDHDISTKTIYNDLHGFIDKQRLHRRAYTEHHKGFTSLVRANSEKTQAEKQKCYNDAITHYTAAINLNLEYAGVYYNRGVAYFGTDDFAAAIEDFNKAIDLDPEFIEAYSGRGVAYRDIGDFAAAIEDFNKAVDLDPENAWFYNDRGLASYETGDFAAAIEDFNKAIDLDPEDARFYYNRGLAYFSTDDFAAAIQDCSKAIDLDAEDASAYGNRGVAYSETGDFAAAIEDFNKAIDLDPEDASAYSNRGVAYFGTDDFAAAIVDFNKAIDLDAEDARFYYNRGTAYRNTGDFEATIEDYSRAIDLNPEYAKAYSDRGKAWLHLKEWQKAKADLTTAKKMGCDIIGSFHNDYESVEDFEAKNEVKVPKDIAVLLSGNKVNDTRQKRNEQYWAAFFEALPLDKLGLKIPNIYDSHYRDLHMGITGCYIRVSQRVRPSGIAAAFVMKGSAQDFLHSLIKQQTEIENELGEKFYCHEAVQGEKQIYFKLKSCDVTDKTDWPDQHQWFAMKLEKLVEVFRPRIEKLI